MPEFTDTFLAELKTERRQLEVYDSSWSRAGSLGLRINRGRGSKNFFYFYSFKGKRRRLPLGRYPELSIDLARDLAGAAIDRLSLGIDPGKRSRSTSPLGSLQSVWEEFLKLKQLKERTKKEYLRLMETEVLPVFGHRYIDSLTDRELRSLLFDLRERRNKLALSNRVRTLLSSLFEFAIEAGAADKNPIPQIPPAPEEEKRKERVRVILKLGELQRLYKSANNLSRTAQGLVQFALLSGFPINLVQLLRWSQIKGDFWEVDDNSVVYLTSYHREILNSQRSSSQFVFSKVDQTPIKNSRSILSQLREVAELSGNWSSIMNSIKHNMVAVGIPYSDVMLVFGIGNSNFSFPSARAEVEWAAKRLYNEWGPIISGMSPENEGDTNQKVVRFRRLKRLK